MHSDMNNYIKQRDENKQVSMTGARALVMFILFLEGPKTVEEIQKFMIECGVVNKEYSVDTVRIDINTLKSIGCQITKATKRTNHKYGIISHPFQLNIKNDEVDVLKEIYNKNLKNISPKKLINFHKLFYKMSTLVENDEIKEALLGISILKSTPLDVLENLVIDKTHNKLKILYAPPNSKTECEYDITVEKFGIRSGKLYLYGFNHTLNSKSFLNISRIKSVLSKTFDKNSVSNFDVRVQFKLNYYKEYILEENETILEERGDYALIEGNYFNEFIAVQRMLSFASDCTIVSPDKIRNIVIAKLKEMRARYE